jgi:membrane-bound ClpP family serine protease
MDILLDPNIAYFLLIAGLSAAILALFSPGTGFIEAGAFLVLIMAGYGIANLPVNVWAFFILGLGIFPFLIALRRSRQYIFLVISLLALVIGSVFLFQGSEGRLTAVNPWLALVVSALVVGFLWLAAHKSLEAFDKPPVQDLGRLIGKVGIAVTDIRREGSVYVGGENWTAQSDQLIPAGTRIRVLSRNGLVLSVTSETSRADKVS